MGRVAEAAELLEGSPALDDPTIDRADAILGLGLLAVARWRLDRRDAAREAAVATIERAGRSRPVANYSLEGYAGAAEVFLNLWECSTLAGQTDHEARRMALRCCTALERFAAIFPIGFPRSLLCRSRADAIAGRFDRAWTIAMRSLRAAEELGSPLDQALAHAELARSGREPSEHRERARALFEHLGALEELARLEEPGRLLRSRVRNLAGK